jgi:hypothetical protein
MKKDYIDQKVWACLKELYSLATPPLDIGNSPEELIQKVPESTEKDLSPAWYQKHELSMEDYNNIRNKHIKNCKLRTYNRIKFIKTLDWALLNYSPRIKEPGNE